MRPKKSTTSQRLSKTMVEGLPAPAAGQAVYWDADLTGFGLRISDRGTRTYFVQRRSPDGRQIKATIGRHGVWRAEKARARAKVLLGQIAAGVDPAADRRAIRAVEKERRSAPTAAALLERYMAEHAERKKRVSSVQSDRSLINRHILPELGRRKVADITQPDVEQLHRQITVTAPIAANRAVALLSKAMSLAIRWDWRSDNPCRGIERNPEERRERYLTPSELGRLCDALNRRHDRPEAACIAFLMLTGARRGETLTARWRDFDPGAGVWTKPSAHTKQKRTHRIPISSAARAVLVQVAGQFAPDEPPTDAYVFGGPEMIRRMRGMWEAVRDEARLPGLRLHDLRHAYASVLASGGMSLPIIGALLGHTTSTTTARYAHLLDDPLRQATERVGAVRRHQGQSGTAAVRGRAGLMPLKRVPYGRRYVEREALRVDGELTEDEAQMLA
jgi:integrase